MSPPPTPDDDGDVHNDEREPSSRPIEFDAPTDADSATSSEPDASTQDAADTPAQDAADSAETTSESLRRTLDDLLPEADVDSNWWYWVAAVPIYFLVTLVGAAVAVAVFVFAALLDVAGLSGLASLSTFVVFGGAASLFGLVGLVVAVLFPIAMYVDARAVEEAGGEWRPDPVLWGLLAVVAVLVTNFVVSVPLSLYYLYKRHEEIGTP